MPSFTLADIQEAADEKYGPTVIEMADGSKVELVNPIRLSKANRARLKSLDKADDDGEIDVDEKLAELLNIAMTPPHAKKLLAAVGGDLAQLKEIVERWSGSSQVGEASPSAT